ncbi:MAG: ABC transporter ATP-binding protein [Saprospiraceae bacterium]|nr:ABC transporter ATP-binding protein [Saprospiraceae bacterium]
MIQIDSLTKRFGKLKALDNISLFMNEGQLLSLIGPNGSGKTTLIKSILGLIKPEKGNILVDNKNINTTDSYRNLIGYMPQMGKFPENIKVGQLFTLWNKIRNKQEGPLDNDLFESFDIRSMENKPLRTLSGGMRQKVSASLAFLFNPKILILDEPTSGLDPISSEILKEKINQSHQEGKLIIITSHILSDIEEVTTHVAYMQDGSLLYYGPFEELKTQSGEKNLSKSIAFLMKKNNYSVRH